MEYQSHPLHTIYEPNGKPYLSIIEEEKIIKMHLHSYDAISRPIFLTIDKRAINDLVTVLSTLGVKE